MIAADDDRPRTGIGHRADPRLDRFVAALDADRRRVHVADVGNIEPVERRNFLKVVIGPDQRRLRPNLARPKPRAGSIRRAAIEGDTDDRNVESLRDLRRAAAA